jgi:hypothetical protein
MEVLIPGKAREFFVLYGFKLGSGGNSSSSSKNIWGIFRGVLAPRIWRWLLM